MSDLIGWGTVGRDRPPAKTMKIHTASSPFPIDPKNPTLRSSHPAVCQRPAQIKMSPPQTNVFEGIDRRSVYSFEDIGLGSIDGFSAESLLKEKYKQFHIDLP